MPRPLLIALRPLGLGDLLTGLPALRALAQAFPLHRRVLAAPAVLTDLARLSGAVDEVLDTRPHEYLRLRETVDVAVDLHGRGPRSQRVLLALRPRRLCAFFNAAVPETVGMPAWREDEHEVARWCRMLEGTGIDCDASRLELRVPPTPLSRLLAGATVVHPGAAAGSRRWPSGRWSAVIRHLRARRARVVITGSSSERSLALGIADAAGLDAESVLTGRTGLAELAAVIDSAGLVVCGDTGVAHLATATGTPSVVLFGPTPPAWWGPPPDRAQHQVLWKGRRGHPHGNALDPGLNEIEVGEVSAAIDASLGAALAAER